MEPKNYKVYSNGIHEIITADSVQYMPNTGQTCFMLNGEMLHVAPASVMVTNTCEKDSIIERHSHAKWKIQKKIEELIKEREAMIEKGRPNPDALSELEKEVIDIYGINIKHLIEVRDELLA